MMGHNTVTDFSVTGIGASELGGIIRHQPGRALRNRGRPLRN